MKRKLKKYFLIILSLCIIICTINVNVYATIDKIDTNYYQPREMEQKDKEIVSKIGGNIVKIAETVGIAIAVIVLAILGIKYMLGSVEEKAEYKKSMMPYLIGCLVIVSTISILSLIAQIM